MAKLILSSMWILPMMIMFLKHPLSMGAILLAQTLTVALITGLMNLNFWFSYILFLIMVGGMLILFIYMTSIASNEKFKFSQNMFLSTMIMLLTLILIMNQSSISNIMLTLDIQSQDLITLKSMAISKYMNWPEIKILYVMIIYLLVTLIMVVKVTHIKYGPIRQMF